MRRPVDGYLPNQDFGDNPTKWLPFDHWLIQTFGNYQPDGHLGEDYPCPAGTPVLAVAAGTVLHVGRLTGQYFDNPWWLLPSAAGWVYVVDHGYYIGIYGHCMDNAAQVVSGQWVEEGQVLGLSGNTGASTGDHLHFEVLMEGVRLDSIMLGRINPKHLFDAAPALQVLGSITVGEDTMADGFIQTDRDNLEKLVHQGVTIIGMLNNLAGFLNESGAETRDNVRKVVYATVDGDQPNG